MLLLPSPIHRARRARRGGAPTRDSLTGLLAERAFLVVGHHELLLAARHGEPASLLCLRLAGREAPGQRQPEEEERAQARVLARLARQARSLLRGEDVVARTGPGELAALLPGLGVADAWEVGRRLREQVAAGPLASGQLLAGCASMAVPLPAQPPLLGELLEQARALAS